ncbi:hypothetical protein DFQ26_002175 [Actinomortierella ambigua]|nr:hypothetical protein DFQ26_002175 [Actinomortierella ambigua]
MFRTRFVGTHDSTEAYNALVTLKMRVGQAGNYNNQFQRLRARIDHFDDFQAVRQWKFGAYPKVQEFVAHSILAPDDLTGHMALAEEIDRTSRYNNYNRSTPFPRVQTNFASTSNKSHDEDMMDLDVAEEERRGNGSRYHGRFQQPNALKSEDRQKGRCFLCHQTGHLARQCKTSGKARSF